jgi:hypothetical protein
MKVTMTKIWVIAGALAILGIAAQAQTRDTTAAPVSKQVLVESNPYLASHHK